MGASLGAKVFHCIAVLSDATFITFVSTKEWNPFAVSRTDDSQRMKGGSDLIRGTGRISINLAMECKLLDGIRLERSARVNRAAPRRELRGNGAEVRELEARDEGCASFDTYLLSIGRVRGSRVVNCLKLLTF